MSAGHPAPPKFSKELILSIVVYGVWLLWLGYVAMVNLMAGNP